MSDLRNYIARSFITCVHCWHEFPLDQTLWISESPENLGDIRLGESAQQRFLPTRFNAKGSAIDSNGFVCSKLACPRCHLMIPRSLIEMPPYFVSIVGAPASGKSYFLASMIWKLRNTFPREFGIAFSDADPEMNLRLHNYESIQFVNSESNRLVSIEKTEVYGSLYDTVLFNDQRISYPQPFAFSIAPMSDHPNANESAKYSHLLCVYDNAGESYLPGADAGTHPVTRHLSQSNCILFLYDPTQDHRFRAACQGKSDDPQLLDSIDGSTVNRSPMRQDTILAEMVKRVRLHNGLATSERHKKPLYIIVTKLDAWSHLLDNTDWSDPWKRVRSRDPGNLIVKRSSDSLKTVPEVPQDDTSQASDFPNGLENLFSITETKPEDPKKAEPESPAKPFRSSLAGFSTKRVEEVSAAVRTLLLKLAPEIVITAEQFAEKVKYIPISATGRAPSIDPLSGILGFRPKDISPIWTEVPILYALSQSTRGIVPVLLPKK